jgi:hypothetical protein
MTDSKKYYVVYWTPVQVGSVIHTGQHPLLPNIYKQIGKSVINSINMANLSNGVLLPLEAFTITWITEMPKEPEAAFAYNLSDLRLNYQKELVV